MSSIRSREQSGKPIRQVPEPDGLSLAHGLCRLWSKSHVSSTSAQSRRRCLVCGLRRRIPVWEQFSLPFRHRAPARVSASVS